MLRHIDDWHELLLTLLWTTMKYSKRPPPRLAKETSR